MSPFFLYKLADSYITLTLLRTREHFFNVYFYHHIDLYFLSLSSSWVSLVLLLTLFFNPGQFIDVFFHCYTWICLHILYMKLTLHILKNLWHHRTCKSVIKISVTSLCFVLVFSVKTVLLPGTHCDIRLQRCGYL